MRRDAKYNSGRLIRAIIDNSQSILTIIIKTPITVITPEIIWFILSCRVIDTISISLVTLERTSPVGVESK